MSLTTPWYHGVRPWGRHSLVLAVAGLAYIFIGMAFFYVTPGDHRDQALIVAKHWMPLDGWAWVFIIVGLATLISARWPPTADKWGYMILTGLSAGWGAFYAAGVIFEDTPISNFAGMAIYWLVAFMWWAISGLVNPEQTIVVVADVDRSG